MKNTISRRDVLAVTAAGTTAIALGALGSTSAFAGCNHDHKKMVYRLGALMVDPALCAAEKGRLLANTKCPSCGSVIEPDGLSYGEHMQG